MIWTEELSRLLFSEISFKPTLSSGAGGQNIQKNKTAVIAVWDPCLSNLPIELLERVKKKMEENELAVLQFKSQENRSLDLNKKNAFMKIKDFILKSLIRQKVRKKTKPTFGSITRRLDSKRKNKEIKMGRQKKWSS